MSIKNKWVKRIEDGMLKEVFKELLWIAGYGIRYKKSILGYILLGVIGVGLGLGASLTSKHIFDVVIGYDFHGLPPVVACYIVFQILTIVCHAITGRVSAWMEVKVDQEIRADVYDKIMEADWESMTEFHSGDILNRVDNDVSSITSCIVDWAPNFVMRMVQFASALFIILYYDATLAALALLSAPITLLISRILTKKMRLYNKQMRKISSEVMSFNEESFQNLQMIKSFGLESLYSRKLRNVQTTYQNAKLNYNKFSVSTSAFMAFIGTLVTGACFGWGLYRLWTGHISYGTMLLFLQLAAMLSNSFKALVHAIPSLISSATAAGRVMALTQLPKEKRVDCEKAKELRKKKTGIVVEAKQIDFIYSTGKKVFQKADFIANPGEIIAIVGASGEGKTTFLRLLLGIVSIQGGCLTVCDDKEQEKIPISAATRKLFSYVPQVNTLFAGTVAENLRIMKEDATDEELNQALKTACAYHFVHRIPTGLASPVKEKGGGFSEGQIQRLSIARAMLSDAPILLLDEATSALDVETEQTVIRNLMEARENRTCIITTHRPSVLEICDRVYRIKDGRIESVEISGLGEK